MKFIDILAIVVVVLAGLYLIVLGATKLVVPARTSRFLLGFVGSRKLHLVEMLLRLIVGAAMLQLAPRMIWPTAFNLFGWMVIGTTTLLLLVPWRVHQGFAQQSVPRALRFLPLIGVASLAFGVLMIAAVVRGIAG